MIAIVIDNDRAGLTFVAANDADRLLRRAEAVLLGRLGPDRVGGQAHVAEVDDGLAGHPDQGRQVAARTGSLVRW